MKSMVVDRRFNYLISITFFFPLTRKESSNLDVQVVDAKLMKNHISLLH